MPCLRRSALAVAAVLCLPAAVVAQQPISGQPVAVFAPVDTIMQNLMTQYSSPGAAVAISYKGKLVYARGYGYAEVETSNPVQPDTIMRWASNSKPLTAAGIYKLIEQGKLTLATQPFKTIFTDLTPPAGTTYNTQLDDITIEELLLHTGGWDDTQVPDPVFEFEDIAPQAFGDPVPATPEQLISYMLSQPLQNTPGTTYAYSNLGYIVLGQVISKVSGGNYTSYESYMQNTVFAPVGLERILPAQTFLDQQLPNEAAYYDYPDAPLVTNVYDPQGGTEGFSCSGSASCVPYPYGGYSLPLNHANGGWAGSAIDVVREWDIMNGQITPAIINNPSAEVHSSTYYPTAPVGPGYIYTFFGSLPGTNSLVHLDTTGSYGGDLTFGAVFNTRDGNNIEEPESDATSQIQQALTSVTSWPTSDLFSIYSGSASSCKFSLGTSSVTLAKGGGTGTVAVTDANYCAWLATSNASWIHVTAGALNSNSGNVGYSVDSNTTGKTRTGTITIAGQTFTVTETGPASSTTTLTVTPSGNISVGQTVSLKATVSGTGGTPTGSVTFKDGSTVVDTLQLSGGSATLTASTNGLGVGTYALSAEYSGDSSFAVSNSATKSVTLQKAATTTTLSVTPSSVTPPASVTFKATVARTSGTGAPTGKVTFSTGSITITTVSVNGSGVATFTQSSNGIGAGSYPITASYAGDASDNSSHSGPETVTVR